jgi:ribosomal protein L37AE/L43A
MRKPILESCQRLQIHDVKGVIPANAMNAVLEIGTQEISVIGRLTNLHNGYRYCFLCPACRSPHESLYMADLGSWQCRRCVGAVYASTRKIRVKSGQHENEHRSDN